MVYGHVGQLELPRASFEETLEFCNKVREAGGGELIEELVPGIPGAPRDCLIANSLNFDCRVRPDGPFATGDYPDMGYEEGEPAWVMTVADHNVIPKISEATGCPAISHYTMLLPARIARVANAFDYTISENFGGELGVGLRYKQLAEEFLPYITEYNRRRIEYLLERETSNDQ